MPVTPINTNATTQLKVGSGYIRQLIVAAPGSAWTVQLKDGPIGASASATTLFGVAPITVPAIGTNVLPEPVFFSNGIQVITAGTTPGELDVDWI